MDRDKEKSSPAPADHKKTEETRNQSTYVENKNRKFGIFFWIILLIVVIGAILVFVPF